MKRKITTPKILMFISFVFILVSTIGFIVYIPMIDKDIQELQGIKNELNEDLYLYDFNSMIEAGQKEKIISTLGDFTILTTLNSSYTDDFEKHLRRQMYQSFAILGNEQFTHSQIESLDKLNFTVLEDIYEKYANKFRDEHNKIVDDIKINEEKLQEQLDKKYFFTILWGVIQIISISLRVAIK